MRYLVRERLFHIKDDFWVADEYGNRVFFVNAKVLSLRHTLELEDASGHKLAAIKHKLLTFTDAMEIEHDGRVVATVHKAVFSPLHHRAIIDLADGGRLEAVGNIIDKDFEIRDGDRPVARVSRAWFRVRDTYGVDTGDGGNDALMIAIAVCMDRIHQDEEERRRLHGRRQTGLHRGRRLPLLPAPGQRPRLVHRRRIRHHRRACRRLLPALPAVREPAGLTMRGPGKE